MSGVDPKLDENEKASALIVAHDFKWCRARLLHALAGADEQGILEEVLEELLPPGKGRGEMDGFETGGDIAAAISVALTANGWRK
jgi:hypothetical protein